MLYLKKKKSGNCFVFYFDLKIDPVLLLIHDDILSKKNHVMK